MGGLLEGMQIAFFAVSKLPKSERGDHSIAVKTCDVLFRNGGKNLPGFMCGRQMTVTLCFFVIARVTTINVVIGEQPNIFGVSDPIQGMFNLGFMGAITTTILGSIAWQLVAGAFPIAFFFLQAALFLEATGICSAAWFFAFLQKKAMKFQFDEYYVGTPEERAAKGHADVAVALDMGTVLPAKAIGIDELKEQFKPLSDMQATFSNRRTKILDNVKRLRTNIEVAEFDEEREAYEHSLQLEIRSLGQMNKDEEEAKLLEEGNKIGDDDDDLKEYEDSDSDESDDV